MDPMVSLAIPSGRTNMMDRTEITHLVRRCAMVLAARAALNSEVCVAAC
jgi:hypothetical protein